MKRLILAFALVGLLLPFAPRTQAETAVSLNFFYDNLSPYGGWIDTVDYGYVFQPNVAVSNSDWRPYTDGYWAYTDAGWTWVSYEDFGWATYHYGRWAQLVDYGWVWVPGYEWGPAWVSWRTGGDYVGWAPLPPVAGERVYEGHAITGQVDLAFNIGPLYYNFVDIRYIGEPVLRRRIIQPQQNVTIINRTVNVTNITYNNSVVYNYGPDFNRVNQYSTRPVQRLSLQRETNVSSFSGRHGNFNRVNGNQLVVAAPPVKKANQQIAPKQVKTKVEHAKVEHGWQGVKNREQLQQEMKKENAQNVPPPSVQPQQGRRGENAANQPNEADRPGRQANQDQVGNQNRRQEEAAQRRQAREEQRGQNRQQQQQQQNADQTANANEDAGNAQQAAAERQARQRQRQQTRQEKQNQSNAEPGGAEGNAQNAGVNQRQDQREQAGANRRQERNAQGATVTEQEETRQPARQRQQRENRQAERNRPEQNAQGRLEQSGRSVRDQPERAQQMRRDRPEQAQPDQVQRRERPQERANTGRREVPQARQERQQAQQHRGSARGQQERASQNENQKKKKKKQDENPQP